MAATANRPAALPVMADVAKLVGVSGQTVSRVLNHPDVRPRTLEAGVRQAAGRLRDLRDRVLSGAGGRPCEPEGQ